MKRVKSFVFYSFLFFVFLCSNQNRKLYNKIGFFVKEIKGKESFILLQYFWLWHCEKA